MYIYRNVYIKIKTKKMTQKKDKKIYRKKLFNTLLKKIFFF